MTISLKYITYCENISQVEVYQRTHKQFWTPWQFLFKFTQIFSSIFENLVHNELAIKELLLVDLI